MVNMTYAARREVGLVELFGKLEDCASVVGIGKSVAVAAESISWLSSFLRQDCTNTSMSRIW